MWRTYGFIGYLIVLSVWDIRKRQIPVVWLGLGCVLVVLGLLCDASGGVEQWRSLFWGILPGILMLAGARMRGIIGTADGVVMIMIGMQKGYWKGTMILGVALFTAAVFCAVFLLLGKLKGTTRIPFVPFLSLAYILAEGLSAP